MNALEDRYHGRPLLRLLECYVLWAIGCLPEDQASSLDAMEPKLRSIYHVDGTWQEVIAASVKLPPELPEQIKQVWIKNTEIARTSRKTLTPQKFAEMFVDENLVTS